MLQLIIHTLKNFFVDPDELYLRNATDLVDLERRMKNINTKSFKSY
jgi:hypothetical protein